MEERTHVRTITSRVGVQRQMRVKHVFELEHDLCAFRLVRVVVAEDSITPNVFVAVGSFFASQPVQEVKVLLRPLLGRLTEDVDEKTTVSPMSGEHPFVGADPSGCSDTR